MRNQSLTASATFVASIFAATAIGLVAAPANAKEKTQTEQVASADQVTTAADTKEAAKVCRRIPSSSSRKTERVCLTKEDWKKVEEVR
jgi:acyl-CoA synthetase (AMP-forming)/AMP-acid ligase II